MANIKSAKKRIKVAAKKTAKNKKIKNDLKAIMKDFDAAIAAGDVETAEAKRTEAEKQLMKAARKSTISKQSASHHVSHVTKRLNALKEAK
ncbi:MAG: 30S ribosomal protein S20 [Eubacteriales bacterium]|nr:30S ribosomal protein S20 [Eubacteriales bacterium]